MGYQYLVYSLLVTPLFRKIVASLSYGIFKMIFTDAENKTFMVLHSAVSKDLL